MNKFLKYFKKIEYPKLRDFQQWAEWDTEREKVYKHNVRAINLKFGLYLLALVLLITSISICAFNTQL